MVWDRACVPSVPPIHYKQRLRGASETTAARGIRNTACCPISAAKMRQGPSLEPTGMSAREIAAQVGVAESTVRVTCRQATQPSRRKPCFTGGYLQRAKSVLPGWRQF